MEKNKIMENIYDLIKETALSNRQNDDWAILSRKHQKEAKRELGRYLRYKNIEWEGNKIKIGKHIVLTII